MKRKSCTSVAHGELAVLQHAEDVRRVIDHHLLEFVVDRLALCLVDLGAGPLDQLVHLRVLVDRVLPVAIARRMVGGEGDVVRIAVIRRLVDAEEVRSSSRASGVRPTMSGQIIGLMSRSMFSCFRLSSMTRHQRRCCSRPDTWTIVSLMPPFGYLRLREILLRLVHVGPVDLQDRIVAEDAVRQRAVISSA